MKNLILPICIGFLMASCHMDYVNQPIPSDVSSLTEIPEKYRGEFSEKNDKATLQIGKEKIIYEVSESEKHHKDSLPDSHQFIYKNNKTYLVKGEDFPVELTSHEKSGDYILYSYDAFIRWDLGINLIVKPAGDDLIFNVIFPEEGNLNQWWLPHHVIEKNGTIKYSGMEVKDNPEFDQYLIFKTDNSSYYESNWDESKVLDLINKGAFGVEDDYLELTRE